MTKAAAGTQFCPSMTRTETAPLVYRGASKNYRQHFWTKPSCSLDALDLQVREGEILGLLGHNGAGKTTSIKLALGLIFPDRGEVLLNGRAASDRRSRLGVGYLPESPYFPDDLTGRELIETAGRLHGLDRSTLRPAATQWLERVGLSQAADRPLRKYSKGMVQRAGMARALVAAPRFVILDEPMSGLDPVGRREFRDLILWLKQEGTTVLFSSHVLADAEMLCDRVAILREGKLVTVQDVSVLARERRVTRWEVHVVGGGALAGAELLTTRGEETLWRYPADANAESIMAAVHSSGGNLQALIPQRETLEDLFLRSLQKTG